MFLLFGSNQFENFVFAIIYDPLCSSTLVMIHEYGAYVDFNQKILKSCNTILKLEYQIRKMNLNLEGKPHIGGL